VVSDISGTRWKDTAKTMHGRLPFVGVRKKMSIKHLTISIHNVMFSKMVPKDNPSQP